MPISLSVEPYRADCPEFEPEAQKLELSSLLEGLKMDTTVVCANWDKCQMVCAYLLEKMEEIVGSFLPALNKGS